VRGMGTIVQIISWAFGSAMIVAVIVGFGDILVEPFRRFRITRR
jgi:hypothetical protein